MTFHLDTANPPEGLQQMTFGVVTESTVDGNTLSISTGDFEVVADILIHNSEQQVALAIFAQSIIGHAASIYRFENRIEIYIENGGGKFPINQPTKDEEPEK